MSPRVKIFQASRRVGFVEQGKIIHPSARRAVLSTSECRDYIALDKSYSINYTRRPSGAVHHCTFSKNLSTTTSSSPGLWSTFLSLNRTAPSCWCTRARSCLVSHPGPLWNSLHVTTDVLDATSASR